MPRRPARAWGSVDRGTCRPGIEPRNFTSGCRRCERKRKATPGASPTQDASGPRAVADPTHARKRPARNPGDPSSGRRGGERRSASGSLRAHADDVRTQEVGRAHSSKEPLEQARHNGYGERGGKGTDQGEFGRQKHTFGHCAEYSMPIDVIRTRHGTFLTVFHV